MATLKKATYIGMFVLFLACMVCWPSGCSKAPDPFDQNWTVPTPISSSIAGLGGAARLYRHQDELVAIQVPKEGTANLLFWNRERNSWAKSQLSVTQGYIFGYAAIDPITKAVLLPQAFCENEQLVMKVFIGKISNNGAFNGFVERQWSADKQVLLGEAPQNIKLNAYAKREGVGLGTIIMNGSTVHIPYSLHATTLFGINNASNGPFASGVFYSFDSGVTWRMEKISDQHSIAPALCETENYIYYFSGSHPLWGSRKSVRAGKWEALQPIANTFAMINGHFAVAGESNTAHICWMDRRHNKTRFNLTGAPIENNDIYYRHREDTATKWSEEVLLSKRLLYCYAPTIAVEGDKVVVMWAGVKTADKQHTDMGPNDIYYVVSRDRGRTWTSPHLVTDGAKHGFTAGMPQVSLLNGTIHSLYIQGAQRQPTELSPGLTRLGQGSWPIYYQQRPFPN